MKIFQEIWLIKDDKIDVTIGFDSRGQLLNHGELPCVKFNNEEYGGRLGLDITYRMRNVAKTHATSYLWEYFRQKGFDIYNDKVKKELCKTIHGRGAFISRLIVARVKDLICEHYGITREFLSKIMMLCIRMFPRYALRKRFDDIHYPVTFILSMKKKLSEEEFNTITSDFSKYGVATAKWLLRRLMYKEEHEQQWDFDYYQSLLKQIPSIVKKCKYGFVIDEDDDFIKKYNPKPHNRFQYYWLIAILTMGFRNMGDIIPSLLKADIKCWHYFKDYMHLKNKPYSVRELRHLLINIYDGVRIYETYKDNNEGIEVIKVEGSPLRMVRNSIFNHRQELKITKKRALIEPNRQMAMPPIELPVWIESIRMKDTHSLINAGIECHHCIGSYTNSNDIFLREKDICCQIDRDTLKVIQCYDVRDNITKESEYLQRRVTHSLNELKKEKAIW